MQGSPNVVILESNKSIRRYDIDWLRVILFGLLIWFHFAVFYFKQPEGIFGLPYFFVVSVMHQWRLAALFVISGMGTAFALRKRTWKQYVKERLTRLGLPLLFTVYILFFGILDFAENTALLFSIFPGSENMPYGHLWFVYNLLIYSIVLTPIFYHVKTNPNGSIMRLMRRILRMKSGLGILILPPVILSINGILLKPWEFGEVGMWWEFPRYMIYFLIGFLLISAKNDYFQSLEKIRIPVTIITPLLAIFWFIFIILIDVPYVMEGGWVNEGYSPFSLKVIIASILQSFHAWFWCLLIFTWASKVLNKPGKYVSYLNESVYATYILHMHLTIILIVILAIIGIGFLPAMIIGTPVLIFGVLACFELVKRASLLRPLFGIKGGREKVLELFPYNYTDDKSLHILFNLIFHTFALGLIVVLTLLMMGIDNLE